MLEVRGLSVFYDQHRAVENASVAAAEIGVMLGANGAGKSALIRSIAGLAPARPGCSVRMDGEEIAGLPPHEIVEKGIALVPEDRGIFGDLTVDENLTLGVYPDRARDVESTNRERIYGLFPALKECRRQIARTTSGGEQQMVAIGRAIMSAPSILLLDEPSLGLSPLLCRELFRAFGDIRAQGVGIFLVEQNSRQGLATADGDACWKTAGWSAPIPPGTWMRPSAARISAPGSADLACAEGKIRQPRRPTVAEGVPGRQLPTDEPSRRASTFPALRRLRPLQARLSESLRPLCGAAGPLRRPRRASGHCRTEVGRDRDPRAGCLCLLNPPFC